MNEKKLVKYGLGTFSDERTLSAEFFWWKPQFHTFKNLPAKKPDRSVTSISVEGTLSRIQINPFSWITSKSHSSLLNARKLMDLLQFQNYTTFLAPIFSFLCHIILLFLWQFETKIRNFWKSPFLVNPMIISELASTSSHENI